MLNPHPEQPIELLNFFHHHEFGARFATHFNKCVNLEGYLPDTFLQLIFPIGPHIFCGKSRGWMWVEQIYSYLGILPPNHSESCGLDGKFRENSLPFLTWKDMEGKKCVGFFFVVVGKIVWEIDKEFVILIPRFFFKLKNLQGWNDERNWFGARKRLAKKSGKLNCLLHQRQRG